MPRNIHNEQRKLPPEMAAVRGIVEYYKFKDPRAAMAELFTTAAESKRKEYPLKTVGVLLKHGVDSKLLPYSFSLAKEHGPKPFSGPFPVSVGKSQKGVPPVVNHLLAFHKFVQSENPSLKKAIASL